MTTELPTRLNELDQELARLHEVLLNRNSTKAEIERAKERIASIHREVIAGMTPPKETK